MYVVDSETGGDKLYGFLYMISGAGATKAVFEGDLMYFVKKSSDPDVYEPERPADGFAAIRKGADPAVRQRRQNSFRP